MKREYLSRNFGFTTKKHGLAEELAKARAEGKKRRWKFFRGMMMTEAELEEIKKYYCSGCGGQKKNPKVWFGELFCGDCVERWRHGEK